MRKYALLWCMGLLFFAFTMSVTRLDAAPVFNDEYHSVRHTGFLENPYTIPEIVDSVATTSSQHVPFYFILLSDWISITYFHPVIMRLLSVFPFLLAISLSYQLGKQMLDDNYGRWFAFFIATSGFAIFFSHQIRMYSFILLFCVWLIWSYWRVGISNKRTTWIDWFGLWCSSVLLVYTHYVGAFALIAIGLYHLACFSWKRRWWTIVFVELLAGSTFLFWIETFIDGATSRKDLTDSTLSFIEAIYHILNISSNGLAIWGLVLILLAINQYRKHKNIPLFIVFSGLVSLVSLVTINMFIPILPIERMRYVMAILPFISLLFALGVRPLIQRQWVMRGIVVVSCVSGMLFYQNPMFGVYTNRASKQFSEYPPYHVYSQIIDDLPGFDEPLVTLSPDLDVMHNIRTFYAQFLNRELTHLWDEPDSELAPLVDLRLDIIQDEMSLLIAHEIEVSVEDVPSFRHVIAVTFKNCQTIFKFDNFQIDYYVHDIVPCELIRERGETPLAGYIGDFFLENIEIVQQDTNDYRVFSWWDRAMVNDMLLGFDLRLIDENGVELLRTTNTMPPKSIGFNDIDTSALSAGTYDLHLVVLNLEDGFPILVSNSETQYLRVGQLIVED